MRLLKFILLHVAIALLAASVAATDAPAGSGTDDESAPTLVCAADVEAGEADDAPADGGDPADESDGGFLGGGDDVAEDDLDVVEVEIDDDLVQCEDGDDELSTGDGDDEVFTGDGDDVVQLGDGDDVADLGAGEDVADGGAGNDVIDGGSGRDRLVGGPGADVLGGGAGADRIEAKDGQRDVVRCGPGKDTVHADGKDRLTRCERVLR
jgi:Ca2+-binding RTX toxin-like protein